MTNEWAIRLLIGDVLGTAEQTQEAVTMAVRALSQPDVTDTNVGDTISRQAAVDVLKKRRALYCDNNPDTFSRLSYAQKSRVDELDTAIATLVNLPSAQSERKKGKWINNIHDIPICSECGYMTPYDRAIDDYEYGNFCPNCGADMREEALDG